MGGLPAVPSISKIMVLKIEGTAGRPPKRPTRSQQHRRGTIRTPKKGSKTKHRKSCFKTIILEIEGTPGRPPQASNHPPKRGPISWFYGSFFYVLGFEGRFLFGFLVFSFVGFWKTKKPINQKRPQPPKRRKSCFKTIILEIEGTPGRPPQASNHPPKRGPKSWF